MTDTTTNPTFHVLIGASLPTRIVEALIPSPVTEGDGPHHRVAVRLTGDGSGAYDNQIGRIQRLSHRIGTAGRMWDASTGAEGDFAVVGPDPVDGRVYLTLKDQPQEAYVYAERADGQWRAFGFAEPNETGLQYTPFAHVITEGVEPAFWVEAKDPRVAPPQVHTPPQEVPALPGWAKFVKPSPPLATYSNRTVYVVSCADPSHPTLAGRFRIIRATPQEHEGTLFDRDVETGAPVVASYVNTGHVTDTYHLWWPSRNAMIAGDDPVIVHLSSSYTYEKVADAHGNLVTREAVSSHGVTLPSVWTPPPGVPLDAEAVVALQREHESLWERWSEAMNEAADTHDWCPDYEKAVIPLGFPGREGRKRTWAVEVSVDAMVTISPVSSRLDAALSTALGIDVVADEVTASVRLTVTENVEDMTREEVDDYVDSSTIEEWLDNQYSGSWDVTDYSITDVEEV